MDNDDDDANRITRLKMASLSFCCTNDDGKGKYWKAPHSSVQTSSNARKR